ncbi:MAG: hypothetical protein JNJ77_05195 [Planctomycetia bacterium]|nr:hypothetical protein [Planctomycetia bacterium]
MVEAKEPYFVWARSVEEDTSIEESEHTPTVYLAENEDGQTVGVELIKKHYKRIFVEELESWWTEKSKWPKVRTWEMFQAWFKVTIADLVLDLEDTTIECF